MIKFKSMPATLDRQIISVSELNSIAKEALEMMTFWVDGEVTGFKANDAERYFYVYFSLQDPNGKAVLSCAMRRDAYKLQGLELENGQKVVIQGKMTLFTQSGRAAFLVSQIEVAGLGKLAAELEKLKLKLQAEGLLSDERKRPLPTLPQRIGVVTAVTSDAWADFQRHTVAKFPVMELIVIDSFVQGHKAPSSLTTAIDAMQQQAIDILVVTRGGGSAEDLAAFNDERVIRAIANSRIPTLVGVGHEKDVSLADLVADVRASTPTNAGQILTKGYEEVQINLAHAFSAMQRWSGLTIERQYQRLDDFAQGLNRTQQKYQSLPFRLADVASKLQHQQHRLLENTTSILNLLSHRHELAGRLLMQRHTQQLQSIDRQLQAVSPLNVLARGYSIVSAHDEIIRSSRQIKQGDTMNIRLSHGSIKGLITKIED